MTLKDTSQTGAPGKPAKAVSAKPAESAPSAESSAPTLSGEPAAPGESATSGGPEAGPAEPGAPAEPAPPSDAGNVSNTSVSGASEQLAPQEQQNPQDREADQQRQQDLEDQQADQAGIRLFEVPVPDALKDRGVDRMLVWATALTVKFRRITVREGMLLHGSAGWGEFSPFWDYGPKESATWLSAGLEAATQTLPAPKRNFVPVNVTVPVVSPEKAHELVVASGCTTAKVKVADPHSSLKDDVARVEAVRDALGPNGKIRVDANGAWTTVEADLAIRELAKAAGGLEYVEQPCATVKELAELRRHIDVPIAADESVRRAEDPIAVSRAEAADLLVIKAQPLGGVRRALQIVEEAGLPAVVSSALDTSIGIALGARLAACLPELDHACGLGTVRLFEGDVCSTPRIPRDGFMAVDRATVDVPPQDPAGQITDIPTGKPAETLAESVPTLVSRWSKRLDAAVQALTSRDER